MGLDKIKVTGEDVQSDEPITVCTINEELFHSMVYHLSENAWEYATEHFSEKQYKAMIAKINRELDSDNPFRGASENRIELMKDVRENLYQKIK